MPGDGTAIRRADVIALFRLAALLAGLSTGSGTTAHAQSAGPDGGGMDSVLKMLNLKTDVGRVPEFVEASRPKAKTDFLPIGTNHPTRPVKVKSAAELQAAEAELDAARVKQDKIAGRKPPDPNAAPVRAKLKPSKPAPTQN